MERQVMDESSSSTKNVGVDESRASVELPRRILNELYAHALETLPEECCGLIVGEDGDRYQNLVRCRNEMTLRHEEDPVAYPRDGCEAFLMSPLDYMRVHDEAEANGTQVTAVYHSHVGVGAYLSAMDLEYAESDLFPFPNADHIVVAVSDRKVDSVAFFRQEKESRLFSGRTVVSSE
jgi:proteasome lid subunit RPN8/RPN11